MDEIEYLFRYLSCFFGASKEAAEGENLRTYPLSDLSMSLPVFLSFNVSTIISKSITNLFTNLSNHFREYRRTTSRFKIQCEDGILAFNADIKIPPFNADIKIHPSVHVVSQDFEMYNPQRIHLDQCTGCISYLKFLHFARFPRLGGN